MKIDIITIFPGMFDGPLGESIIERAQKKKLMDIGIHDLRDWTTDKRKTVDDKPYGGGTGMIIMAKPVIEAISSLKKQNSKVIMMSPRGSVWTQSKAKEYSKEDHLIIVCGHYEGIDERIRKYIDEEISIGDYILTGGEIPSMVVVDSIGRLIPGVLEKEDATQIESFSKDLLEYPQYTRPKKLGNLEVPEVLLSGNHQKIEEWKEKEALKETKARRPDLLKKS